MTSKSVAQSLTGAVCVMETPFAAPSLDLDPP